MPGKRNCNVRQDNRQAFPRFKGGDSVLMKGGAEPRPKGGDRREDDKKLQQLALYVKAVFSSLHHMLRLRIIVLEEMKF